MTLEEARERIGHGVIYRPTIEQGTITSVNDHWVFVRYGSDMGSKATDPTLLAPLAAPVVPPLGEGDEELGEDADSTEQHGEDPTGRR